MALLKILHESRRAPHCDSEHIVKHENLSIDVGACADPDDRHIQRVGHRLTEFVRHAFEQHDIGVGYLLARAETVIGTRMLMDVIRNPRFKPGSKPTPIAIRIEPWSLPLEFDVA